MHSFDRKTICELRELGIRDDVLAQVQAVQATYRAVPTVTTKDGFTFITYVNKPNKPLYFSNKSTMPCCYQPFIVATFHILTIVFLSLKIVQRH